MGYRSRVWAGMVGCVLGLLLSPYGISASSSVNTLAGSFVHDHTDTTFVLDGSSFGFVRTYRSDDSRESRLGPGWKHNFGMYVAQVTGTQDWVVVGPQGRTDRYTPDQDGGFVPRGDLNVSLVRNPDGSYAATQEDGATWTFDRSGRLTSVQQPGKPVLTIVQSALGPSAVVDREGHAALLFDYDSMTGRLLAVTDVPNPNLDPVAPRSVRFTYDDKGRLASATDRAGARTQYAYGGDGSRLASITDARGHVAVALKYDENGRVVEYRDARGALTGQGNAFEYTVDGAGLTKTAVEHRVASGFTPGFQPALRTEFVEQQEIITAQSAPADEPLREVWSRDPSGQKGWRATRSGGGTPLPSGVMWQAPVGKPGGPAVLLGDPQSPVPVPVCVPQAPVADTPAAARLWASGFRVFDARVAAWRSFGEAAQHATSWTLDGFNRPVQMRDANGSIWHTTFDQEDRPLSALDQDGAGALVTYDLVGNVVRVEQQPGDLASTFDYDERDDLASVRWPTGDMARYEYDDRGDLSRARFEPADGGSAQVAEYAFDAFHRIRRTVRFINWPDPTGSVETDFAYDDDGGCSAFRSSISTETT